MTGHVVFFGGLPGYAETILRGFGVRLISQANVLLRAQSPPPEYFLLSVGSFENCLNLIYL